VAPNVIVSSVSTFQDDIAGRASLRVLARRMARGVEPVKRPTPP
jgi:hypothetical protein